MFFVFKRYINILPIDVTSKVKEDGFAIKLGCAIIWIHSSMNNNVAEIRHTFYYGFTKIITSHYFHLLNS